MRGSCFTCHIVCYPEMKAQTTDFILVTFISSSLLLFKHGGNAASKLVQTTVSNAVNNDTICHNGFMSVYISKVEFADLPLAIYVQDDHNGYFQAIAVAKQCSYFLAETDTFIIFTVASHGCFVRTQKHMTYLTVIVARAHKGRVEIVKSIPLICERKVKEVNKTKNPLVPRNVVCNKDGFNITIFKDDTVPALDLDKLWIPSSQSHRCKPKMRSKDAVNFSFPFTDCGTQSMIADGIIIYWVNIEVKQHLQKGFIFREIPFHFHVYCSFTLAQIAQLAINVDGRKPEYLSTLKNEGILQTEMRFAKDSSYKSFYSSRDPPVVTEIGQPVYVEVLVPKHWGQDLVLLLGDCWATPTKNPNDTQKWNLLVKGCPFRDDTHRTVVLPVVSEEIKYPSLHKWFVVKLFSFVKPPTFGNLVYFHCDVEICKGPGCLQVCSNGGRKFRRTTTGQNILHTEVSGGPLLYLV